MKIMHLGNISSNTDIIPAAKHFHEDGTTINLKPKTYCQQLRDDYPLISDLRANH